MIKFFRRIRQQLLNSGEMKKYSLYAIGEILLVVIGILIALQINNWNEQRKDRNTEKDLLESLHRDFSESKKAFNHKIKPLESQNGTMSLLLTQCGPQETTLSLHTMDSLISRMDAHPSFEPTNGTINNILNSGKIGLIQNQELRDLLSNWHARIEDLRNLEVDLRDFMIHTFQPYLEANAELIHKKGVNQHFPKTQSFQIDSRVILSDFKFCNLLKRGIYRNTWSLRKYRKLEKEVDRILELTQP